MKKILSYAAILVLPLVAAGTAVLPAQAANYTSAQVAAHNTASDCWMIISGNVYNLTAFIPIHPGGNAMVPYCGTDATAVFDSIHSSAAFALLPTYLIGTLASSAADTTTPTVPTGLAGTSPSGTVVNLSWTASSDPDNAASTLTYNIFRNGNPIATTTAGAVSFVDTGLTASTTYSYMITASDPAGNTSVQSLAVSVTTLSQLDTALPAVPTGLASSGTTVTSTNLSWTASSDADDAASTITYTVYRNGAKIGSTVAGATTFMDTGLTASTTYSYTVSATDPAGNSSAQSTTLTVATLPTLTTPPPPSVTVLAEGTYVQLGNNPTVYIVKNGHLVLANKAKKSDDDGMENEGNGNKGSENPGNNHNAGTQTGSVVHVGQVSAKPAPGNSAFGNSHNNKDK